MSENILKLRSDLGWSQAELGRRANVNKETINRIENGGGFTSKTLTNIASALGTTTGHLQGVEAAATTPPSPELKRLLFLFSRLSVKARLALLATAEALLEMQQAGTAPH
jgi:transcriptional regulator with XRE-family HTH domain